MLVLDSIGVENDVVVHIFEALLVINHDKNPISRNLGSMAERSTVGEEAAEHRTMHRRMREDPPDPLRLVTNTHYLP